MDFSASAATKDAARLRRRRFCTPPRFFSTLPHRVFQSDGIEIVRTPFCAPQANGVAERFVRTVRAECLDWLLILNGQHLEQVVRVFIDHYNGHRPHRALALAPPTPVRLPADEWSGACILRRDRLGGAIHEYTLAA